MATSTAHLGWFIHLKPMGTSKSPACSFRPLPVCLSPTWFNQDVWRGRKDLVSRWGPSAAFFFLLKSDWRHYCHWRKQWRLHSWCSDGRGCCGSSGGGGGSCGDSRGDSCGNGFDDGGGSRNSNQISWSFKFISNNNINRDDFSKGGNSIGDSGDNNNDNYNNNDNDTINSLGCLGLAGSTNKLI